MKTIRLSDLAYLVAEVLHRAFDEEYFWVLGEVTSHKYYADQQRHFFDFVEKQAGSQQLLAKVSAVAWREGARQIARFEQETGQRFGNNLQVLLLARVDFHELYGLKLTVTDIDSSFTLGLLQQQKQEVLQRLLREGGGHVRFDGERYITTNQQMPMPLVLQRLAIISSESAAGLEDFLHTLDQNPQGYRVQCDPYYARVQGTDNSLELARRFQAISDSGIDYDAIVLIRGGGAQTDLLIFDQFDVSLAIARSAIPVITGIGHQRDSTLADLMAHTSVKTPTQAAEWILERMRLFEAEVIDLHQRTRWAWSRLVQYRHQELAVFTQVLHNRPIRFIHKQSEELNLLSTNVHVYAKRLLIRRSEQLESMASLVNLLHPDRLLKRGLAMIYRADQILADPSTVRAGEILSLRWQQEILQVQVLDKKKFDGND